MSETRTSDLPARPRLASGIPGLDEILGGGFFRRSIYIINGRPGAGKTIFGSQICFWTVRGGERALFVTLLAETHGHLLANLETLSFYDADAVSRALTFINGYSTLEREGLSGLLALLRSTIREQRASVLVIDGLVTAEQLSGSDLAFKKFIHELQTLVGVMGCTVFLLSSGRVDGVVRPEHTMVDGIVDLQDELEGVRSSRTLVIRKLRGTAYLRGRHAFEISDDGVRAYPRTESRYARPSRPFPPLDERPLRFGAAGFDDMFGGGVSRGTTTLMLGSPGAGKTLLGLSFLHAGAAQGQRGLHFGFNEHPEALLAKARRIGLALGGVDLLWQPPVEHILDALAERLLGAVRAGAIERLFLDGLVAFKSSVSSPERLAQFFPALFNELRALGVTTLVSEETRELFVQELEAPLARVSALWDNILMLRELDLDGERARVVSVLKRRDGPHERRDAVFAITAEGIKIQGRLVSGPRTSVRAIEPIEALLSVPDPQENGLPRG